MPLYKYVGNKILTRFENFMLQTNLTEFHSGYRAYSVKALSAIPFESNSDGFNFDTQIIIQLIAAGKRIAEVPIPTYYGDEICYVNGLRYAKDVCLDVIRYRAARLGFSRGDLAPPMNEYGFKADEDSSHGHILKWLSQMPPSRVLDLGCAGGAVAERARSLGHTVVGVDIHESPGIRSRLDRFVVADLDEGIPAEVGEGYDIVVAADVIEHVRHPERLLADVARVLVPHGVLIASVPNFGHWYPRLRVVTGLFDYDQRGILDQTHMRFFTRRSFRGLVAAAGYEIIRQETVGLPLEALTGGKRGLAHAAGVVDRVLVTLRPTLFGYQFLFELRRRTADEAVEGMTARPGRKAGLKAVSR
jgi:SAM-dependent methyltransferase